MLQDAKRAHTKKVDGMPKLPINIFMRYCNGLRTSNPENLYKGEEGSKLMGEMWRALAPLDPIKIEYKRQYEVDMVAYNKEVEDFKLRSSKSPTI